MGEKRKYKPRKPGGGRKKLKPEYDAGKNLKEQMDAAVTLYNSEMSLQAIADALNLNPIKVRKLLITAGVYESDNPSMNYLYHRTFLCPVPYVHKVGIRGKNQKFPRLRN